MREILFRGKQVSDGEWIEGYVFPQVIDGGYAPLCITTEPICANDYSEILGDWAIVDSSTVGQYTGLNDKTGKKIFEGDILSIAQKGNGIGDYFYPPLKYPSNAIVKWDKCSWMWEIIAEQRYYLTFPDAWCHYESKVIGNIHDNPELLEVKE